ncbi:MAG: BTAD domain-containing putative transcriptional regulator [Gemmatimonadaceae bacterium]
MTRTLSVVVPHPAAILPVQLTGFIGRAQELAAVRRLVGTSRLLTLTGAGGSGKTRLALEVAGRLRDAGEAEVAWLELGGLTEKNDLAAHAALALDIRTAGGGSPSQAITARLRASELLLVLDNCEQVVEQCARLVEELLRSCPRLRVLATSREALGVEGERSWLVPLLALPDRGRALTPSVAMESEAVRLFMARAHDVLPTFALVPANVEAVDRVCRRLDGLPLAIELAAARVSVLTPEQIAERLDDRFALLVAGVRSPLPRHRTLRAAVDWSYDLLSGPERLLLERLSVFAGGFTLDAAEQVCAGGAIPESRVLELLGGLTMRSLIAMHEEVGRARYRLLETIREYAAERRHERGDTTGLDERHARYFLALAREAEPDLILGHPARMRQADLELDNARAALAWSSAQSPYEGAEYALPLAWALMWHWFHRQLWREGHRHFAAAFASAPDAPPALRAAALHGLGLFGLYIGDPLSAARLAEAESLWKVAGKAHRRWLAFTLLVRATEASLRRDPASARAHAEQAMAVARTVDDPWVAALVGAHALVPVLAWEGQWAEAERVLAESERVYRARDYAIGVAYVLDARAFAALQLGELERAAELALASLREDPQRENRWLAGRSLRTLGAVAAARSDLERAARLVSAADAMYEAIGAKSLTEERRAVNELPEQLRVRMPEREYAAAREAGRAMTFAEALAYAEPGEAAIAGMATLGAASGATAIATAGASPPILEVRALGQLEILRDGSPVPSEAWRYAKPRELLLYLLVHPEGRTREQIGLDFWPDISAAQVKNNFHVTLHHLRKALGGDARSLVRWERDRYRLAMEDGVVFDAARFEAAAHDAMRRLREQPGDERAGRDLAAASSLHRGPFLEDQIVGDWHIEVRDRLVRIHELVLLALGAHHASRGAHADAAACYRRLMADDALNEEAVRRLMTALARDGRRAEALRAFARFESELRSEMGASPERATSALAARLRDPAVDIGGGGI